MHTHTFEINNVSIIFFVSFTLNTFHHMMKSAGRDLLVTYLNDVDHHSLFAACSKSLISLIILLICCDVLSSSFSWRLRFSRNSGLSSKQSANSSGDNDD